MSPRTVDYSSHEKQQTWDVSQPDRLSGQPGTGIAVKEIPHMDFPRVIYKHPNKPFRSVEYRNSNHELIHSELVPTEHISKAVKDEAELKAALADGWVLKPYVPAAPENPDEDLYSSKPKEEPKEGKKKS